MKLSKYIRLLIITFGITSILASGGGDGGGEVIIPVPVSDTTPNAFSFQSMTGQTLDSLVTSQSITVTGIDSAAAISVSGGEYSINESAFTTVAGTVSNNDQVKVRHTTSADYAKAITTNLSIGGVNGGFTSTTKQAPMVFRSSVTNVDLRSIDTGEPLIDSNTVFEGTTITVDN